MSLPDALPIAAVDEGADRTRSRRQRHRLLREAGGEITQGVRISGSRVGQIEKLPIIATGAKNGDVHLPTSPGRSARGLRMIPNRQLCRSGASITTLCHNPSAGSPSGANLAGGSGRTSQCRDRSEEHTSDLQSLMRISYAVFCLKQQNIHLTSYAAFTIHTTQAI